MFIYIWTGMSYLFIDISTTVTTAQQPYVSLSITAQTPSLRFNPVFIESEATKQFIRQIRSIATAFTGGLSMVHPITSLRTFTNSLLVTVQLESV